jgi:hypothetical protein
MPHNHNINDPNLDELLRESLLGLDENNPDHQKLMDEIAESVFSRDWPAPADKEKEAKLLNPAGKTSFPKWIWMLSSVALIALLGFLFVYLSRDENKPSEIKREENVLVESPLTQNNIPPDDSAFSFTVVPAALSQEATVVTEQNKAQNKKGNSEKPKPGKTKENKVIVPDPGKDLNLIDNKEIANEKKDSATSEVPVVEQAKSTLLPQLSDAELSAHRAKKLALAKRWSQLKLDDYSHIHVSSNVKLPFRDFYMKRGEVSNADYDLFLKDLIIRNMEKEYLIAKPGYEDWLNKTNNAQVKTFIKDYFTCTQYLNYPVTCISADAAKLYCEWLEAEIINANKGAAVTISARLPYDDEWKFAANPMEKKYGTEGGKLKSLMGPYRANFKATQINPSELTNPDSEIKNDLNSGIEGWGETHRVKLNYTTTAMAFMMNEFGLYNMSGNVSEMVLYRKPDKNAIMRTIGGNWNSEKKFLEIGAGDEFSNKLLPSPFVGFRPEVIITSKTERQ